LARGRFPLRSGDHNRHTFIVDNKFAAATILQRSEENRLPEISGAANRFLFTPFANIQLSPRSHRPSPSVEQSSTNSRWAGKSAFDYVIRRFNASSARAEESVGLNR